MVHPQPPAGDTVPSPELPPLPLGPVVPLPPAPVPALPVLAVPALPVVALPVVALPVLALPVLAVPVLALLVPTPPRQVPARHSPVPLHGAPSGLADFTQAPVALSHALVITSQYGSAEHGGVNVAPAAQTPVLVTQLPASWHLSAGAQTTGFPPAHTPAAQASFCVQASLSSHGVLSAAAV